MEKFGVIKAEEHPWSYILERDLYCIGYRQSAEDEFEPFCDQYLAELADVSIEELVDTMESFCEGVEKITHLYRSDNGGQIDTDTYFLYEEHAKRIADFLNGNAD